MMEDSRGAVTALPLKSVANAGAVSALPGKSTAASSQPSAMRTSQPGPRVNQTASGASATASAPNTSSSTSSSGPAHLLSAAAATMQQQRSDRLVAFLVTLVSYPVMYLLTKRATAVSVNQMSGVGGAGGIDTRNRLADFPEGAALLELESWCHEPVFSSWVYEWATRLAVLLRQLTLTYLPYPIVLQVLHHPWVLKTLQIPPSKSLQQLVNEYMPRAEQLLAQGAPHVALRELQALVEPNLVNIKATLETRASLSRGPTLLERLDFVTRLARFGARLFFAGLRGLARLCTYTSSVLSVISGALSFTVVPSIILSVISAVLGVVQLSLMGTADLLEPGVNALLALTETSKDTAAALGGVPEASPVGCCVLPASTVEQLETFFDTQLKQESGLLNRPEIPRLSGLNKSLLVKAYDLGLIDVRGRTETRVVAEMLAAADAQTVSHVLLRGLSRAAVAATSFDVPTLLAILQQTVEGTASAFLPSFAGGRRASLRQLFRPDGFFAYADDRQAQVATVLLVRLLSWLHLTHVVYPGSNDCLRFVLVLGERQAGKASLFSALVDAPADYAAHLGATATQGPLDGTTRMSSQGNSTPPPETDTEYSSRSKSSPVSSAGQILAPAVDMQQLAGQPNTFVVCVPGLHSSDQTTRKMAQRLAGTIARLSSAVVFLVHPSSEASPTKLNLLIPPLTAGCHCLVAINGPSRLHTAAATTGAPHSTSQASPLESVRARWQSAAETLCAQQGLNPSLLGVVVSEVLQPEGYSELPAGVQHLRQVQDWVLTASTQSHRVV